MKITSTSNPLIKDICLLHKNSYRKQRCEFLVQGNDFIEPARRNNVAKIIFSIEEKDYGIPLQLVSKEVLNKISLYENSLEPVILCSFLKKSEIQGKKLVLLDGVQDPGNVGTIIRSALAFSYDGVILANNCASLYSQKVLSASKGAVFDIPVFEGVSFSELKRLGYEIIVTSLEKAVDYKTIKTDKPFAVVFGSEGQGVSKDAISQADKIVKISIDAIDSLNVAVAAGIILERYR